jgi:predicted dinucleotide-binding enzyme
LTVVAAGDEQARRQAVSLAEDIGFETTDAGPLANARYLESLAYLNRQLAFDQQMGSDIGFRLVNPRGG